MPKKMTESTEYRQNSQIVYPRLFQRKFTFKKVIKIVNQC